MSRLTQRACALRTACRTLFSLSLLLWAAQAEGQTVFAPQLIAGQPTELRRPAVSGSVVMELVIDRDGKVQSVEPIDVALEPPPADAKDVVAQAEQRARELQFQPALRDQQPVAARVRFQFRVVPEIAGEQSLQAPAAPNNLPAPATAPASGPAAAPPSAPAAAAASAPAAAAASAPAAAHASAPAAAPSDAPSTSPADDGLPAATQTPPSAAVAPLAAFGAHAQLSGGAGRAAPSAASDLRLEVGALRAVPRRSAQDFLTLAPGVVLSNHAGIGHAASMFMRGFDAGEGQDIAISVDGMQINEPSNAHAHGYADTQFVIPEVVDRVRVLEGPFDPEQGDFAVAGSAAYELGVRERGIHAQLGYGSYAEKRALLLWAPSNAHRGTFAAVDLRGGDGFGPNRAHSSLSALARYDDHAGELHYAILLGSHALDFDSAGVIREDTYDARELPCAPDADSQFFCVVDPNQGGAASRHFLNTKLEWRRPDRSYELQAYGVLRKLRMRENFTGNLLDPRGDGLDEGYETAAFGAHAAYALTPTWLGRRQRLELGFDARYDTGETRSWRLRSETAVPYATVFDSDIAITHLGAYLKGELRPLPFLTVLGGARFDGFAFQTVDRAAPDEDRVGPRLPTDERDAFGSVFSPRGSVVAHITDYLDWTVSAGLGARSSDALALSENEDAPFARVLALETGPSARAPLGSVGALDARAFAFATRVEDDMLFDPTRGRNVPVGPSNRYGISTSARARFGTAHDTLLSFTWTEAEQSSHSGSIFELNGGQRLPFVPRFVTRIDHASNWGLHLGSEILQLGAAGGLSWVGPQPLPLKTESEARWQLDLSLRARIRWIELGVSIENLFDRRNHAADFNYPSHFGDDDEPVSMRSARHFAAAHPRLWMFTLTAHFDDVADSSGEGT